MGCVRDSGNCGLKIFRRNYICNDLNMEYKLMFFIIKNGGKDVMYNVDNI